MRIPAVLKIYHYYFHVGDNSCDTQWVIGGKIEKITNAVDDGKAAQQSASITIQTID